MARKTRARDASYVERAERRKGWGWVRLFAGASLFMVVPTVWVLLLNGLVHGFGFLAQRWQAVFLIPAAGLWFTLIVVVDEVRAHRNVDREGISLIADEAGVYLGLARPRRLAWADIAQVALITYRVPRVRHETPETTEYYAAFLLDGVKEKEDPMRWRPRKEVRDGTSLDAIEAAIRRYAPSVSVFTTMR